MKPIIFHIYRDRSLGRQQWRWHASSGDKIIADSGEGYASKWNAKRAVRRWVNASIVIDDGARSR